MVPGECKKHPGVQRVAMKNSRNGTYYACPTCVAEKKGGGLPPPPPSKRKPGQRGPGKKTLKKSAKKTAAKKVVADLAREKVKDAPKSGGLWGVFKRVHGLG